MIRDEFRGGKNNRGCKKLIQEIVGLGHGRVWGVPNHQGQGVWHYR
jgi:hypothetical protein